MGELVEAPTVPQTSPSVTVEASSPPAPLPIAPIVNSEPSHGTIEFENPLSFIEASIEKIDTMIEHIVMTHSIKLEEASGYKQEKEKFAELEAAAYRDAEKMMKEKAHAEKMKTYFINQQSHAEEGDQTPESVETTLTSLSVKNSVNTTTHDHEGKKTSKKHSPKTEPLIDAD